MCKSGNIWLKNYISQHGAISVSHFMRESLTNKDWGYYINRNPLGKKGDFITAVELGKQMAETIALWLQDQWIFLDCPKQIIICELGAGTGSLMRDILSFIKIHDSKFYNSLSLKIIEVSPYLKNIQADTLSSHTNICWHTSLDISVSCPILFIAHEFFDAIPIDQYVNVDGVFYERLITFSDDNFQFTLGNKKLSPGYLPSDFYLSPEGAIYEISIERLNIFNCMLSYISKYKGGGIIVDYGSICEGYGDSLQAIKDHKFVDIFSDVGNCDLTSHVNFGQFKKLCQANQIDNFCLEQGKFLQSLNLAFRITSKFPQLTDTEQYLLAKEYDYLTNPNKMGKLFKVFCFGAGCNIKI
ncbi:SAM-dependent methyltransferase [Bartonella sp. DGB1]|uniref:SAM-dependent methyltransferase n=1 Tax=Bartonella sp. DGB1 TaxID=3239807 RepID=UPI003524111B